MSNSRRQSKNDKPKQRPEPNGKVGKLVKVIDTGATVFKAAKDIYKIWRQHPEWYTHYKNSQMINLDYGLRKDIPIQGSFTLPALASCELVLTKPGFANTQASDQMEVDTGWKSGIQRLFTSMRGTNTSTAPFTLDDVDHYVVNCRAIHALYAMLRRVYATLRHFEADDSRYPKVLIEGMGFDYEDFKANMSDIQQYGYTLGLAIATQVPLKVDLIDRTRWLFSVYFADSNDTKASYIGFNALTHGILWYSIENSEFSYVKFGTQKVTFSQLANVIDGMIGVFSTYDQFASISSEMFKAFGARAIYPVEDWPLSMQLPIVYDETAITQIQNANFMGLHTTASNGNIPTLPYNLKTGLLNYSIDVDYGDKSAFDAFGWNSTLRDSFCEFFVNANKDTMLPGDTLSAMRFVTRWRRDPRAYEGAGGNTISIDRYHLVGCNTECLVTINFFNGNPGAPGESRYYPREYQQFDDSDIAAPMYTNAEATINWTSIRGLPRLWYLRSCVTEDTKELVWLAPAYDMWDWNNYADQPSFRNHKSMNSNANQSLLYVDFIVSQARWSAIDVESGKVID